MRNQPHIGNDLPLDAPDATPELMREEATTLIIACGALAREIIALIRLNGWRHLALTCLPAKLHNYPDRIVPGLRAKIRDNKGRYERILVAYADCGTGGELDRFLAEEGVERIAGAHCYGFFAGQDDFAALAEEELGSFYLTDYLARHFDSLIVKGMGLDRHPEMRDLMFGNYRRLVYLAQTRDPALDARAAAAATRLGLAYKRVQTGYGELTDFMHHAAEPTGGHGRSGP